MDRPQVQRGEPPPRLAVLAERRRTRWRLRRVHRRPRGRVLQRRCL